MPQVAQNVCLAVPVLNLISGQRILAAEQLERSGVHDEMQKAFLGADRAIAFGHAREIAAHAKAHAAAMATALDRWQRRLHLRPRFAGQQ